MLVDNARKPKRDRLTRIRVFEDSRLLAMRGITTPSGALGTFLGRTTYHLALSDHQPEVFTPDLPPEGQKPTDYKLGRAVTNVHTMGLQGVFFRGKPAAERITQLHGDCRTFDYSPCFGTMDLVFVDIKS